MLEDHECFIPGEFQLGTVLVEVGHVVAVDGKRGGEHVLEVSKRFRSRLNRPLEESCGEAQQDDS